MKQFKDGIPNKVLKEIFPEKLSTLRASETVYTQLKQMIISRKLKKGERLIREKIAQDLNVSENAASIAFSKLKKDGLVIIKGRIGSFVA